MGRLAGSGAKGAVSPKNASKTTTRRAKSGENREEPGGRNTTRHRGSLAEMQFMIEAARRAFGVAKPFGDYERYDVILDCGVRMWRVQVKLTRASHHRGF